MQKKTNSHMHDMQPHPNHTEIGSDIATAYSGLKVQEAANMNSMKDRLTPLQP